MSFHSNYQKAIQFYKPKPSYLVNCLRAFVVGGLVCTIAQFLQNMLIHLFSLNEMMSQQVVLSTFIIITAFLTGGGLYRKIGRYAGAGSFATITGFANSFVSAALEHRSEGLMWGVSNQMFKVGGAVIVYGVIAAYILGIISYVAL